MAIGTPTVITSGASTTDGTSIATASVTPTANSLALAMFVSGSSSVGGGVNASSVTGNGMTWELIDFFASPSAFVAMSLWRAVGAAPSAGVITATYPVLQESFSWQVIHVPGSAITNNGADAIVQFNHTNATTNSISVTLPSALKTGSITLGMINAASGSVVFTAGSGYTLLGTAGSTTTPSNQSQVEYNLTGSTTVNATFSATGQDKSFIGVEIGLGRNFTELLTPTPRYY